MARTLKVFSGSPDGTNRVICATTSKTAFCKMDYRLRFDYVNETANEAEIALCMTHPGVLFIRQATDYDGHFKEWTDATAR